VPRVHRTMGADERSGERGPGADEEEQKPRRSCPSSLEAGRTAAWEPPALVRSRRGSGARWMSDWSGRLLESETAHRCRVARGASTLSQRKPAEAIGRIGP